MQLRQFTSQQSFFDETQRDTNFTAHAAKRWAAITPKMRQDLLSNVWCDTCKELRSLSNLSGTVRYGDLLLLGTCNRSVIFL